MPYLNLGETPLSDSPSGHHEPLFEIAGNKNSRVIAYPQITKEQSQINQDNGQNSLVFSVADLTRPETLQEPNDKSEEVVMVVPTAVDPDKKLAVGSILIFVFVIAMTAFLLFIYFGYKQYILMMNSKKKLSDSEIAIVYTGSSQETLKEMPFHEKRFDIEQHSDIIKKPISMHYRSGTTNELKTLPISAFSTKNGYSINKSHYHSKPTKQNSALSFIDEDESEYSEQSPKDNSAEQKEKIRKLYNQKVRSKPSSKRPERKQKQDQLCKSTSLGRFINSSSNTSIYSETLLEPESCKNSKKIVYSIKELIDLEPIKTYQMFEYNYEDGDLLVTDLIFPIIPLKIATSIEEVNSILTDIRITLVDQAQHSSNRIISLLRFITFSFGLKKYNNPYIYTLAYGILIENMIEFNLVNQISNEVPLVIQSAFVETIIMYSINCWKYSITQSTKFEEFFKGLKLEPYIPNQTKLFKNIITLLLQGFRTSLLEEVLIFFSMPPSPHLLQNVIADAIAENPPTKIYSLLCYLQQQLVSDHYKCCANVDKLKRWELTTCGQPTIKKTIKPKIITPTPILKYREDTMENIGENYNSGKEKLKINNEMDKDLVKKNTDRKKVKKNIVDKKVDDDSLVNEVDEDKNVANHGLFSSIQLRPDSIKMQLGSPTNLPGSLGNSPIQPALDVNLFAN